MLQIKYSLVHSCVFSIHFCILNSVFCYLRVPPLNDVMKPEGMFAILRPGMMTFYLSLSLSVPDIWSLGVILYMLVCGVPPFHETNDSETLVMILDCRYTVPEHVSDDCRK